MSMSSAEVVVNVGSTGGTSRSDVTEPSTDDSPQEVVQTTSIVKRLYRLESDMRRHSEIETTFVGIVQQPPIVLAYCGRVIIFLNFVVVISLLQLPSLLLITLPVQYRGGYVKFRDRRVTSEFMCVSAAGTVLDALTGLAVAGVAAWCGLWLSVCVGYATWRTCANLLRAAHLIAMWQGGEMARDRGDTFRKWLLSCFGVTGETLIVTDSKGVCHNLVAILPAMLAGFMAFYFTQPMPFVWECDARLTSDMPGVHMCVESAGVCCKLFRKDFAATEFVAFLAGNWIAGFHVVKFCALAFHACKMQAYLDRTRRPAATE